MHPMIREDVISVAIAVVASFAFGWIWYGPVFGKLWLQLMKFPPTMKPDAKMMMKSIGLVLLGTVLTVHVMVYATNVWRPSVWGTGTDMHWCDYGFYSGLFTWLGFYVPMLLNSIAWEMRSWKLFLLNAAHSFANLQIIGMIVSYFYAH